MNRGKRIYLTIAVATLLLIYLSFWLISYSVFQGYVIAGFIFSLSVLNYFIVGKTNQEYPTISVSIGTTTLTILNYRLLAVGLLCFLIGLIQLWLDFHNPFAYIVFSTGLFVAAFAKIIWQKKARGTTR